MQRGSKRSGESSEISRLKARSAIKQKNKGRFLFRVFINFSVVTTDKFLKLDLIFFNKEIKMSGYQPMVREVLSDIPEMGAAAFDNNVRPAIRAYGSDSKPSIEFEEIVDGTFKARVGLGDMKLEGTSVEDALMAEAGAFGKFAPNIALIYRTTIQEGKPLGEKRDRTPYEIQLVAPAHFQVRDDYGASGGDGRIVLYGLNLEDMTGFNAGEQSKKVSAYSVGQGLNWGEESVIKDFLPFAGNKDYFVQGQWTSSDMRFNVAFKVENVAYGMRRNNDQTLEVIPVHDSFKEVVTPEAVQRVLKALSGK